MKQIFLCLSANKQDSNAIKLFLQTNKECLAKHGYLYPTKKKDNRDLAKTQHKNKNRESEFHSWEEISNEIEKSSLPKSIIRFDNFISAKANKNVQELVKNISKYNVKVIVYISRQDKIKESSFNQAIEEGKYAGGVDFFLKANENSKYLEILDSWSQIFDKKNVTVRPLEIQQIPNIYLDFLDNIEIDDREGFIFPENQNICPSLAQIVAANYINQMTALKMGLPQEGFQQLALQENCPFPANYLKSFFKDTQKWQSKTQYKLIPYEIAMEILQQFQKENTQIAKQYLNREDGKLFYEILEVYENESLDIKSLEREQAMDLCAFLVNNQIAASQQRFQLRQQNS